MMAEREEEKERGGEGRRKERREGKLEHLSVGANLVPHTHCLTAACLSLLGGSQEMLIHFR